MIKDIIAQLLPLATEMAENGKSIVPVQNSPVGKVADSMLDLINLNYSTVEHVKEVDEFIVQHMTYDSEEKGDISVVAKEQIELLADFISGSLDDTISNLRDITPVIKEFSDAVKEDSSIVNANKGSDATIQVLGIPTPVIQSPEEFKLNQQPSKPLGLSKDLPLFSAPMPHVNVSDEIEAVSAILTGNPDLDKEIRNWLGHVNLDADVKPFLEDIFKGKRSVASLESTFPDPLTNVNAYVYTFLYVRNLLITPNPLVEGLSLDKYNSELKKAERYLSFMLSRAMRTLLRFTKNDVLVVNRTNKVITVMKETFDEYLASGGTHETLLGNLHRGGKERKVKDLLKKVGEDKSAYESYVRIANGVKKRLYAKSLRTLIINNFNLSLTPDALTEVEQKYAKGNEDNFIAQAKERCAELVWKLTDAEINDIDYMSMFIITNSRFWYTPAFSFFTDMNSIKAGNPDATAEEVRLLSISNYVTTFIAQQVKKVSLY